LVVTVALLKQQELPDKRDHSLLVVGLVVIKVPIQCHQALAVMATA
jgi:hypothetical protein